MRIRDWSSDVCSSDLPWTGRGLPLLSLLIFIAGGALGLAAGAAGAWYWARRRSLCTSVFAAVPKPWQVVAPDGRTILAHPALTAFFGGDDRPTPALLLEQGKVDAEIGRATWRERGGQVSPGRWALTYTKQNTK